jgi:hypothetical protein
MENGMRLLHHLYTINKHRRVRRAAVVKRKSIVVKSKNTVVNIS